MDGRDVVGYAGRTDGLDVTAFDMGDHLALLWTAPVDGERQLVGLELAPRLDEHRKFTQWGAWLRARVAERKGVPAHPLPVGKVRGVPLRELMGLRADHVERAGRVTSPVGLVKPDGRVVNLEAEDLRHLDLLQDAVRYVQALTEGLAPAEVIAQARGISKRTAEGRIARARKVGLLTPATERARGGELTARARDLVAKFQGVDAGRQD